MTPVSISKINESYNADKAGGDTLIKENETIIGKVDNKSYFQDNPSEISSISNTNKVSINSLNKYFNYFIGNEF